MIFGKQDARAREGAGAALQRLRRDDRGVTAVLLALTLAVLIGMAGLGVEAGLWYAIKRVNQSGADVAALSGAMEVAAGKLYQTDICPLAKAAAQANNFTVAGGWACPTSSPALQSDCTGLTSGQICVNNPPLFGPHAGASFPKHVEVILAQQQNGFLASLWLANVMIDTRAVAGPKTFDSCMIALNTSGTDLKNNGATTLQLNNCSFISNSTSTTNPNYSLEFNGNVYMQAGAIQTAGGTNITGNSNYIAPPVTQAPGVLDPYAGQITVPTLTSPDTCISYNSGSHTLLPSVGTGGIGWYGCTGNNPAINLIQGSTTTFCPGVYMLDNEDNQGRAFIISSNSVGGTVVNMGTAGVGGCPSNGANGVTIIATCKSSGCGGGFLVGGTGNNQPTVALAAPTTSPLTGIPKEILFYQVAATADVNKGTSTIAGGPTTSLNGVIYTPATEIDLQGNPTLGSCTELIAAKFVVGGNPVMNAPLSSCGLITQSASTLVLVE